MGLTQASEGGLKISNAGTNGQYLQKQSGNTGGLTWATVDTSTLMPLAGGTFTGDVTFTGANYNIYWDSSDNGLRFNDNAKARFGTGSGDLLITHNGTDSVIEDVGTGSLIINASQLRPRTDKFIVNNAANNENMLEADVNAAVQLYYDNVKKFETTADGVTVTGDLFLDNPSTAGRDIHWDVSVNTLKVKDNTHINFGTGDDLQIYHDGSDSYIDDAGTGDLCIRSSTIYLQKYTGENCAKFVADGAVELYHDNTKKFETTSAGAHVWGNLDMNDNAIIRLGTGTDLQLYHDGSHSYIKDAGTGQLRLQTNLFSVENAAGSENILSGTEDGAVNLYHNGVKKFETSPTGATFSTTLQGGHAERTIGNLSFTNCLTPPAAVIWGNNHSTYKSQLGMTFQGTSGNWSAGNGNSNHLSHGILFHRFPGNDTSQLRGGIQSDINSTELLKIWCSYGDIVFKTDSASSGNETWETCDTEALRIHHDGHMSLKAQPYGYINYANDGSASSNAEETLEEQTSHHDEGGMNIGATNRMTVPYTGIYLITASIGINKDSSTDRPRLNLKVNGSKVLSQENVAFIAAGSWNTFTFSQILSLSANDYLDISAVGRCDGGNYAKSQIVLIHGKD